MKLIIGSRGSELALWQANFVQSELEKLGVSSEIKIIKTKGDLIQNLSFDKMEGKGFFTKEIEAALLSGEIDVAVHSHKDLETSNPEGLTIAAVSYRENPSDVLLIRPEAFDNTAPLKVKKGAVIGTSSARRKSQLLLFDPSITIQDLRGNVPTRIKKLTDGAYDAILLAAAGLERLNIDTKDLKKHYFNPQVFVPAPAQGVLGIQIREADEKTKEIIAKLNHPDVQEDIHIERSILRALHGGCQVPFGAYCHKDQNRFKLWVSSGEIGNNKLRRFYLEGTNTNELIHQAVDIVKADLPKKKVLITREENDNDLLAHYLNQLGVEVEFRPYIRISPIRFTSNVQTDWIFFSSKNSVKHFFNQQPVLKKGVKFGVIGTGTADELQSWGHSADFIGGNVDTTVDGKTFQQELANGATVLFPQSKNSFRTIQRQLEFTAKVFDLYVYDTEVVEDNSPVDTDVVVFTSPSNVEGFFRNNKADDTATYVCIGNTTAKALKPKVSDNFLIAPETTPLGLCDAITSAVFSNSGNRVKAS
jgi:hydroxymethylbilane synthase